MAQAVVAERELLATQRLERHALALHGIGDEIEVERQITLRSNLVGSLSVAVVAHDACQPVLRAHSERLQAVLEHSNALSHIHGDGRRTVERERETLRLLAYEHRRILVARSVASEVRPLHKVELRVEVLRKLSLCKELLQLLVHGHILEALIHERARRACSSLKSRRVGRHHSRRLGARHKQPDEEAYVLYVRLVAIVVLHVYIVERQLTTVQLLEAIGERVPDAEVGNHILIIHREHDSKLTQVVAFKFFNVQFLHQLCQI